MMILGITDQVQLFQWLCKERCIAQNKQNSAATNILDCLDPQSQFQTFWRSSVLDDVM